MKLLLFTLFLKQLQFHQPPGLCLSCLSFSSSSDLAWFMREWLTGAGLLCMDTLSCIHGHTFLHSWTHFLAFMDTLSCIHGHTFLHSWTHFLAFMDTLSCIHGHTFLHSWTHFLAFMDTLSCIHGHTFLHSWSGPMTLVVGLLHGATFLSNLPLVLFVSFIALFLVVVIDTCSTLPLLPPDLVLFCYLLCSDCLVYDSI